LTFVTIRCRKSHLDYQIANCYNAGRSLRLGVLTHDERTARSLAGAGFDGWPQSWTWVGSTHGLGWVGLG